MSDATPFDPPIETSSDQTDASPPEWDDDLAERHLGQYALVGITIVASDQETVLSQFQYHGRIVEAHPRRGIKIACEGAYQGKTLNFPPGQHAFRPAPPGDYELRSTGELVKDPDVLSIWTRYENSQNDDSAASG
jgi:hypothetical protein